MNNLQRLSSIPLTVALFTLSACSEDETGSEARIKEVAEQASVYCHSESTFNNSTVFESPFTPNEYHGVYVEQGGLSLRHIIVGTAPKPNEDGGSTTVAYECEYLQHRKEGQKTVDDNFGVVSEGRAYPVQVSGFPLRNYRDDLREYHGVDETSGIIVHQEPFSSIPKDIRRD